MPKQAKVSQAPMFGQGEDLPLFSGTAQTVKETPFVPEEAAQQPRLPGMAPDWSKIVIQTKRAR